MWVILSPAGDAGHSSLPRQRRLTRRKPTLPGAEQSRVLGALVSSYGPEFRRASAGTGLKGHDAVNFRDAWYGPR